MTEEEYNHVREAFLDNMKDFYDATGEIPSYQYLQELTERALERRKKILEGRKSLVYVPPVKESDA